jgi:hypothetical protein
MEAPFYIAVSKMDELAGQPSVTLDSLAGRSWVLFELVTHDLTVVGAAAIVRSNPL